MDTNTDGVKRLSKLADEMFDAEVEVDRIKAELNRAAGVLKDLAEFKIPDLMDELEVASFETSSGLQIKVKETARANLSKDRLAAGVAWLRENGQGGLVKSNVLVPFATAEGDEVKRFLDSLAEQDIMATHEESVNAQSLSAAVRVMFAEGEPVPEKLLGVYIQRVAKIQKKKK